MTPKLAERIEHWPLERLKPYSRNARTHSPAQVDMIARSIQTFGFTNPILVDGQAGILAGHGRLAAAQKLRLTAVPVIVLDHLSEAERRAYILADNKLAEQAGWNDDLLEAELRDLAALDFDLTAAGFSAAELERMLASGDDPRADECPPAPETPVSRRGDLWLLGRHRLLCGDATSAEDVARLMDGRKADMVFTDPPYGVAYDGGTTKRDKLVGDDDTTLYAPACLMAASFSEKYAALYLWHAGVKGIAAAAAAAAAGYEIRCELVWNKNLAQFGSLSSQYKQKHEPCYYCFRRGVAPQWFGPTNEVTVWDCDRAQVNEFHPTQKPVALSIRAIGNSTKTDQTVLDLFGGSGSTLIGCEKTGRIAHLTEIDPRYCDVIVTRWQEYTGQTATLDGDGRAFAAIREERLEQCPQ